MASARKQELNLTEKAFWYLINTIERRLFTSNFIVSNQTPFDVIYGDRIMSLRHYLPLEEDEIRVGDRMMAVNREIYPVPLVLVPPLAATSMIFDLLPQRSVVRFFLAVASTSIWWTGAK